MRHHRAARHDHPHIPWTWAVVVAFVLLGTFYVWIDVSRTSDQRNADNIAVTKADCERTVYGRNLVRSVIKEAFADSPAATVVLPDDPSISPEVHAYLQRVVTGLGLAGSNADRRARVLAKAPPLRCEVLDNGRYLPVERKEGKA